MNSELMKILNGNFECIKTKEFKQIKIFLSSTFSDFHAERDYLIENVYPKLRDYCKERYNIDFQIVDLRWGIKRDDKIWNHNISVCVEEVETCLAVSAKPSFVAFVGQRYGNRPLPEEIPAGEFENLQNYFKVNNKSNKLEMVYKLDENSIPKMYKILPRFEIIGNYFENLNESEKLWDKLEGDLKAELKNAAFAVLNEDERQKYFISVTENEIKHGILNIKNADDVSLVFIREFVEINDAQISRKYFDLSLDSTKLDVECKDYLNNLKYKKIPQSLSKSNIIEFKAVAWDENFGVSLETHEEYLQNFGTTFYDKVKMLIDRNITTNKFYAGLSEIELKTAKEVISHGEFCNELNEKLLTRHDIYNLKDYIEGDSSKPLIIYGESGSGKTSILASLAKKILADMKNTKIILRFLGTTPNSSNICDVLATIIVQIELIYGLERLKPDYKNYTNKEISDFLIERLKVVTLKNPDDKIVILLDSIDQLNPEDYKLEWFIGSLIKNVKIIYTTLTTYGGILDKIKAKIPFNKENYFEIQQLEKPFAISIIDKWLSQNNRKISDDQRSLIDSLFDKAKLYPLYTKLVYDVISNWRSYYKIEDLQHFYSCTEIDKLIEYIFEDLEKIHGSLLVKRCMFYLTSFETGISEGELEDILSVDNDVLEDLFETRDPPVYRFPMSIWTRIKRKIEQYLTEKQVDNTQVIFWYHRRFFETARRRYINGTEISKELTIDKLDELTLNVLDVFTGKWTSQAKGFSTDKRKPARRLTALQPFQFQFNNGTTQYNMRKINNILKFASKLYNRFKLTEFATEKIYLDYTFMYSNFSRNFDVYGFFAACAHQLTTKPREVLTSDEDKLLKTYGDGSRATVRSVCLIFIHWLYQTTTDMLFIYKNSISYQITSRLLVFYGICNLFTSFIDDIDNNSLKHCALVTPYPHLSFDSAGVFPYKNYQTKIKALQFFRPENLFILGQKCYVLNLNTGEEMLEFNLPQIRDDTFFTFKIVNPKVVNRKNITSNLILAGKKNIYSMDFTGIINFHYKYDNYLNINNIFMLNEKYFLVTLENENFCQIFSVKDKNYQSLIKKFESKIQCVVSNQPTNYVAENFSGDIYFAFLFVSKEIFILKRVENQIGDNVSLEMVHKILVDSSVVVNNMLFESYQSSLCVTFNIEMILVVTKSANNTFKNSYFNEDTNKRLINGSSNFEVLEFDEKIILLKTCHGNLIIFHVDKNKWLKIQGTYEKASFKKDINSNILLSAYDGNFLDVYLVEGFSEKNSYKIVKIIDSMYHMGEIKDFLFYDQRYVITISTHGRTFRTIMKSMIISQFQENKMFNKSFYTSNALCGISDTHVVSYSIENELATIWNVSNGKLENEIKLNLKKIKQITYLNDIFYVIGSQDESTLGFLAYKNQKSLSTQLSLEQIHESIYNDCTNIIFSLNQSEEKIIIALLNHKKLAFKIEYYKKNTNGNKLDLTNSLNIDLHMTGSSDSIKIAISCLNNYPIAIQNKLLTYYSFDKQVKAERAIQTNEVVDIIKISPIKGTDNICILDSNYCFSYIVFNNNEQLAEYSMKFKVENFEIKNYDLCVLNKDNHELVVYDLRLIDEMTSFEQIISKIVIKLADNDEIEKFCFSEDSSYLFTFNKLNELNMYRLKGEKGEIIANIPLHCKLNAILVNNKFVCMTTLDKRVISFLICDPTVPSHIERIKQLDSRKNKSRQLNINDIHYFYAIINQNEIRKTISSINLQSIFDNALFILPKIDIDNDIKFSNQIVDVYLKLCKLGKSNVIYDYQRKECINKLKESVKELNCVSLVLNNAFTTSKISIAKTELFQNKKEKDTSSKFCTIL